MFGVVMTLLVLIGIIFAGVLWYRKAQISAFLHAKRDAAWTTYYFKTKVCSHIHIVPLDGRDHWTDESGDCQCHTNKTEYSDDTIVYQHQRIGV